MRMFKKFHRIAIALLLFQFMAPANAVDVPATFNFTGAGYGHGVGMSQIGAKARAVAGESATAILKYYYKNVEVLPVPDTATIRVNIGHALKSVTFTTTSFGTSLQLFSGDALVATVANKKKLNLSISPDLKTIQGYNSSLLTLRWVGGAVPVVSVTKLGVTERFRYGQINIRVVKGALEVTTSLSLHDEYLLGISEVSSSWPTAILEAQTIASRSYALSKMGSVKASCDCHLYSHIADQNFVGYAKEGEARVGKIWRDAVLRTTVDSATGLAILSGGKPIQAYFFSSSGGATQTTADAWGGFTAYTQSVPDSASVDTALNPRFASWKASTTQALVAAAFGLQNVATIEIVSRNSAGAVTWVKGTSSEGVSQILRGDTFRSRAKLPSPWFTLVTNN
ncbi:SpoIID Sporulation protein and related proteins [Candidatus Nanopelagicaceae bacterium]